MSTAAVMLVKDEDDILGYTLEHLAGQVDHIYIADNGSTDGTEDVIADFGSRVIAGDFGDALSFSWRIDEEVGYFQSRKTTELAMEALYAGHSWVVPCDADEWWYATDGRRLADFLAGLTPDVMVARAELYNHFPSALDPSEDDEPNPFRRIGWRQRQHGALPKVAARLRPDLTIEAGNHSATFVGTAYAVGGLCVRHFSWRSAEQYVRKIRNGEAAYAATDLPATTGEHWRRFADKPDEAIADSFRQWFWFAHPDEDDSMIYDPAP